MGIRRWPTRRYATHTYIYVYFKLLSVKWFLWLLLLFFLIDILRHET